MSEHSVSLLPDLSVLFSLEFSEELLEEVSLPFSVFLELLFSVPLELEDSVETPAPFVAEPSLPPPESELPSLDPDSPPSSDPPSDPDRSELVSAFPEDSASIEMRDSRSTELLLSLEVDCLDRN